MEPISIEELRANPKNPRRISRDEFSKLQATLKRFGDLGGIVRNIRSGNLVGGHRRIDDFKTRGGQPYIEERFDTPTSTGTVSRGYILVGDEKFSYREVDWSPGMETAAMIAANAAGGEFDKDLLAQDVYELQQMEDGDEMVALTALSDSDLDGLNKLIGADEDPEPTDTDSDKLNFKLTREQREVVEEALAHIISHREMAAEENGSKNGSALYYLSRDYLDRLHADQAQTNQEV